MTGAEAGDKMPARALWRQSPGWLRAVLVLSVSLNLAVAGAAIGHRLFDGPDHGPRRDAVERLKRLVPEARHPMIDEIAARHGLAEQAAARREAMRGVVARIFAALRADPFEPDALASALEARSAVMAARADGERGSFVEIAAALSAEERRMVADALEARARRWLDKDRDRE